MSARRRLFRWTLGFGLAHSALLGIVGLRYLWYYGPLEPSLGWAYAVLAYVGHLSALAYLPLLAVLLPAIALTPWPRVVVPLGVCVASAGLSLLVLDSLVFAGNRYHLGAVTLALLAPTTWAFLGVYFALGAVIEALVAAWVWRRTAGRPRPGIAVSVALGLVTCLVGSHLIHVWAEAHYYVPVTAFTR